MMEQANSPFYYWGMITDSEIFFGRKSQIREAFNALAGKPQSICLWGDAKIGRSSFLRYIEKEYAQYISDSDQYKFVYINLNDAVCTTHQQFRGIIAKELFGANRPELTPFEFKDLLHKYNSVQQRKYIVLLDDFHILHETESRKEEFNDSFYNDLHALGDKSEITWILATERKESLDNIILDNNLKPTFFGSFHPIKLEEFGEDEARDAIFRYDDEKKPTTLLDDTDFITISKWLEKKYHPCKLNVAADLLWKYKRKHKKHENREALKAEFDAKVENLLGTSIRVKRKWRTRYLWTKNFAQQIQKNTVLMGIILSVILVMFLTLWGIDYDFKFKGGFFEFDIFTPALTETPVINPALTETPTIAPALTDTPTATLTNTSTVLPTMTNTPTITPTLTNTPTISATLVATITP